MCDPGLDPGTKKASLEKQLVPGFGQGERKISLDYLLVPKIRKCSQKGGDMVKSTGTNLKEFPTAEAELSEQYNNNNTVL